MHCVRGSFQKLLEAVTQAGEDISDGVLAVICNLSHNTHWIVNV